MCQGSDEAAPSPCKVLLIKKEVNPAELDFLLRFPSKADAVSPVDFLQPHCWGAIKVGRLLCRGNGSTAGAGSPAAPSQWRVPSIPGVSEGEQSPGVIYPLSVGPEGALRNGGVQELGQRH